MTKSRRVSEDLELLRSVVDTNIFASGLINCAVAGNAKYLVTKNIRHFPKRYENVEVIRIGNFLAQIGR